MLYRAPYTRKPISVELGSHEPTGGLYRGWMDDDLAMMKLLLKLGELEQAVTYMQAKLDKLERRPLGKSDKQERLT